ncbi:MAG: RNA polymerase sigma factor [Rickettsiales bacterium]
MRAETEDKKKLNALCVEYRQALTTGEAINGRTARNILGEMYPVAERVCGAAIDIFKNQHQLRDHADAEAFDNVLFDKMVHVASWPETNPNNFSNLLLTAVRRGMIDELRKYGRRHKHYINASALNNPERETSPHAVLEAANQAHKDERHAILLEEEIDALKRTFKSRLSDVPEKQLKVFKSYLNGDSKTQTAELLGIPKGSVGTSLRLVRKRLDGYNPPIETKNSDMDGIQKSFVGHILTSVIDELITEKERAQIAR